MTYPYDPTSGYQPNGGWGYQEWGGAGREAWDQAGQATAAGDTTGAASWTEVAQQADANAHDTYVAGGPGYGSGGDSSGFNDGTYWGTGGAAPTEVPAAAPTYDTAPAEAAATPSYDTGAAAPVTTPLRPAHRHRRRGDTGAVDTAAPTDVYGAVGYDLHTDLLDHDSVDAGHDIGSGHDDFALGF